MSDRLAAAIPHSVLRIIEGAGHMVHYFAPQELARAVEAIAVKSLHHEEVQ
jgi:pimeloyl-ACP methyl ester carboxylesterase